MIGFFARGLIVDLMCTETGLAQKRWQRSRGAPCGAIYGPMDGAIALELAFDDAALAVGGDVIAVNEGMAE